MKSVEFRRNEKIAFVNELRIADRMEPGLELLRSGTRCGFKNDNEIGLLLKQISAPTFQAKKQQHRSYSFMGHASTDRQQLKRADIPTSTSVSTAADNAFSRRHSSSNGSFIRRNYSKTKTSLYLLWLVIIFFISWLTHTLTLNICFIKWNKLEIESFLLNRFEIAAEWGHQMSWAAAGHADFYFVRAAGFFQEARRSRNAVLERLGQAHETSVVAAQIRKIKVILLTFKNDFSIWEQFRATES